MYEVRSFVSLLLCICRTTVSVVAIFMVTKQVTTTADVVLPPRRSMLQVHWTYGDRWSEVEKRDEADFTNMIAQAYMVRSIDRSWQLICTSCMVSCCLTWYEKHLMSVFMHMSNGDVMRGRAHWVQLSNHVLYQIDDRSVSHKLCLGLLCVLVLVAWFRMRHYVYLARTAVRRSSKRWMQLFKSTATHTTSMWAHIHAHASTGFSTDTHTLSKRTCECCLTYMLFFSAISRYTPRTWNETPRFVYPFRYIPMSGSDQTETLI